MQSGAQCQYHAKRMISRCRADDMQMLNTCNHPCTYFVFVFEAEIVFVCVCAHLTHSTSKAHDSRHAKRPAELSNALPPRHRARYGPNAARLFSSRRIIIATPAEIQAELDTTGKGPTILRMQNTIGSTLDSFYVDGGIPSQRTMWVDTTAADTAAAQATTIRTALAAYR